MQSGISKNSADWHASTQIKTARHACRGGGTHLVSETQFHIGRNNIELTLNLEHLVRDVRIAIGTDDIAHGAGWNLNGSLGLHVPGHRGIDQNHTPDVSRIPEVT